LAKLGKECGNLENRAYKEFKTKAVTYTCKFTLLGRDFNFTLFCFALGMLAAK
jgi:hypothetical protein